jgi:hypothetical protein
MYTYARAKKTRQIRVRTYLVYNATVAFYWVKRFDSVAETIVTSEHVKTYQHLSTPSET